MPPVWARTLTIEYASTFPTTVTSTGTLFNAASATSTGTGPALPAFLPLPLPLPPLPPSPTTSGEAPQLARQMDKQRESMTPANRPGSLEGCKRVDFTQPSVYCPDRRNVLVIW